MLTRLTDAQKQSLFHDGYIILKGVIPWPLIAAARARIEAAGEGERLGTQAAFTDLVNASPVTPILTEAMGQFDPPSDAHVGITPVTSPNERFSALGYRGKDLPYFESELHNEGLCYLPIPQEPVTGSPEEIYRMMIARGPKGDLGRCADVIGLNRSPLFQDPEMTLSLGSFTAFVIIPLNEQPEAGMGQTSVVPGGHRVLEAFHRWQFETSGCIGPEGPAWPRFDDGAPNRAGTNYLPDIVKHKLIELDDRPPETTPDGRPWPRPMPLAMEPGDVAITVFQLPHTRTRNAIGAESRKNIIFRLRNKRRQPNIVVTGRSDHPDRGDLGEWLEFEPGNDPWARSKYALTHMWDEWEGMQQVVADEGPRVAPVDFRALVD